MTIKKKLLCLYGLAMTLTLAMGISAIAIFQSMSTNVDRLAKNDAIKLSMAGELDTVAANIVAGEQAVMLHTVRHEDSETATARTGLTREMAELRDLIQRFRPMLVTVDGKAMVGQLDVASGQLVDLQKGFYGAIEAGDLTRAGNEMHRILPVATSAGELGQQLLEREKGRIAQSGGDVLNSVVTGRWTMIVLMALTVVLGFALYFVIVRLDVALRSSVGELMEGAEEVAKAASQISSASNSLALDTSQQAASIEETSASSEEINSMARRNVEHSSSAADLASSLQGEMALNNKALGQSLQAMEAITGSSEKIQKIIDVIEQIAFQTNILALNAAVEAARAGDAGLGFAVVADEVRNLARRCSEAAQDTSTLIESSVAASRDGKARVEQVVKGGQLITEQFEKINKLVDEIKVGSQEQGKGVSQINGAFGQMEQGTQRSSAAAGHSAAAAEELTLQSESLKEVALRLRAMVGVDGAPDRVSSIRPVARYSGAPAMRHASA